MLRKRKNRRYNETNDEEGRKFDLASQVKSDRFDGSQIKEKHLIELHGDQFTLRRIQKDGFEKPILVTKPDGLDLRVPPKSFLVRDVRNCVGQERIIDVMDVKTQKNIEMSMKDWCKYYESKNRDRLLNVISLEFSHTKLDDLVESPIIVKLLDWVDLVWPKFLKESQTESTNKIDKMKYPKVQKYCLMSVKGSYTDFHIDFGGTSVWYHILRGKKIFWMVPPTELNLQVFEEWTLSGMQQDVFFGDTVEECFRVELHAGNTFFIPSGWIHAVYTLEDSLVFGGNFLHSFGIENQLKVAKIEDATKVPVKFRFPFYTEILWYVVQHYVYCLTDKDHLHRPDLAAVAAAAEAEKQAAENIKSKSNNSIEIEDESTESEQNESDTKNKKRKKVPAASSKQKRSRSSKKAPLKKTANTRNNNKNSKKKKMPPSSDDEDDDEDEEDEDENDDESTDIDSGSEELAKSKQANKPAANTCRMTKNSLLRLQYEIEEKQQQSSSAQSSPNKTSTCSKQSKGGSPCKSSTKKGDKKAEFSQSQTDVESQQQSSSASTTINLAEMILSHESKLNGWSGSNGQSTWSGLNSESNEPKKIHLTKFEINGLKVLVKYLSKLSGAKKNLPNLIRNSRALLDDCRKLIADHENDDPVLAITGKPITPELMREPKRTDMNELIGQFFRSSSETTAINETASLTTTSSLKQVKIEPSLSSTPQQNRLKANHSSEDKKGSSLSSASSSLNESLALKTSVTTSTTTTSTASSSTLSSSPHKETKCLSPNKKLSSSSTSTSNSAVASPPPRPKSPPTRPLSNNQYTSKTKNNNNLLLPGSFEDLIAATSTEKRVFDVSGADVVSSLFGMKDLASSSTKSSSSLSPHLKKSSSSGNSTQSSKTTTTATASGSKLPLDIITSLPVTTTSSSAGASSKEQQPKPTGSPEPPKPNIQKRFISPNNFKQQTKEKLIFASAPYVSPINASDQARANNPYPWQTPTHQQPPQTPQHYQNASQTPQHHHPPTPAQYHHQQQQQPQPPPQQLQPPPTRQEKSPPPPVSRKLSTSSSSSPTPQPQPPPPQKSPVQIQKPAPKQQQSPATKVITTIRRPSPQPIPTQQQQPPQQQQPTPQQHTVKPRGPPKKSKEARQAIESVSDMSTPTVPVSVIKVGPASLTVASSSSSKVATASISPPAQAPAVQIKAKRPKKLKESSANSKTEAAKVGGKSAAQPNQQSQIRPQQPSTIYGLVAPTTSAATSGAKLNPQSYIISRPLLFNTMPTFSTAQFQQMPRASMPLITTSMGLPLQQGARIVWATPPRQIAPPLVSMPQSSTTASSSTTTAKTTTTVAGGKGGAAPKKIIVGNRSAPIPSTSHADNAALLSLATTALSTAPMATSPALSNMNTGTRAPGTQAIMMNAASLNQQAAFFANHQAYFRPYMQQMPMPQFVASPATSSGGGVGSVATTATATSQARPTTGQLVFARLPNQSQPRYLITQPGFMQQRFQAPTRLAGPTPTLAYATFKPPPAAETAAKVMKTKKVKTS